MAVFLISYDLNRPGQKYDELFEAIKSYGTWSHRLDSTWLIETSKSLNTVSEHLLRHIDNNDNILIIEVKDNYAGWMPKVFWTWLKNRF